MDKPSIIRNVVNNLISDDNLAAKHCLAQYPFQTIEYERRSYSNRTKIFQFAKDGFIDRYSGERLLNPGVLRAISFLLPEDFPFHPHWKMSECHMAYWELTPTIDHIIPIARGGRDDPENWATTSMMHNAIKSNWTMEQLRWRLYPVGNLEEWDGLTNLFIRLVDNKPEIKENSFVAEWYRLSKNMALQPDHKE